VTRPLRFAGAADPAVALPRALKRYDRIGFGRRGVLAAEQEVCTYVRALPYEMQAPARAIVLSWLDPAAAEQVAAELHYTAAEHVQALAIRLCAAIPIADSVPRLRGLQAHRAFAHPDAAPCRDALRDALARLDSRDP
jgi:hypothetical protein